MGISRKDHGRLDRVRRLDCDLKANAERLEDVRDSIGRLKSMRYGDKVQHSGSGDYIADSFAMLESIEDSIIKQSAELEAEKQEIISSIRRLKRPEHVELLYLRYVRLMDYESISEKMGYDVRHLFKMNRKAVIEFEALEAAADQVTG